MTIEGWGTFFCIVAAIVIWQTKVADKNKAIGLIRFVLADGLLLLSDAIAIGFRGREGEAAFYIVRISNFLVFVLGYLVIVAGVAYFSRMIEKRAKVSVKNWRNIEYIIGIIGIIAISMNAIYPYLYDFDEHNRYFRLPYNGIITFTYMVGMLLILALLLNFFKELGTLEKVAVLSALIFPFISLIFQLNHYGISFVNIASCVSVIFTFVAFMMDYTKEVAARERERERWITDEKIRLLHNQIKPHFIYNTLTSIYYGLDEDTEKSKTMLKNLSGYLRGSLDVLDVTDCIEFARELETVRCYLNVESVRFEHQISFDMDIQDLAFKVPAFCVQTLVENSLKHGIRKKNPPEGKVIIRSREKEREHIIEIEDDGVGFDVELLAKQEGKHIGVVNTIKRIKLMCNGTMEIDIKQGIGTLITIRIPKEQ
ncbi:sensor histidine kinase [Eubacterium oxidoreducens]|nr:histidine kinase [Eubacterium oxidoreducens]